jgi:acetyl-CoA carboxylase carboxyl transferase subunit alpha
MLGGVLEEELRALSFMTPDQLVAQRAERFYEIGRKGF